MRCGWIPYWCTEKRRPYYHNIVSGEVKWRLPEGAEVQQVPVPDASEALEIAGSSDEWTVEARSRWPTLSSSSQSGAQVDDSNRHRQDDNTNEELTALTGQEPPHHGSSAQSSNTNVEVNQTAEEESEICATSMEESCSRQEQQSEEGADMGNEVYPVGRFLVSVLSSPRRRRRPVGKAPGDFGRTERLLVRRSVEGHRRDSAAGTGAGR